MPIWSCYKPNDPGTVTLGEPFLIGAVRHNNFPIMTMQDWVHSSFDIRIGDLEESFPFDQYETVNDTETTAVPESEVPTRRRRPFLTAMAATPELPTRLASAGTKTTGIATVMSARAKVVWTSTRIPTRPLRTGNPRITPRTPVFLDQPRTPTTS